jgi:uncharacterized protein
VFVVVYAIWWVGHACVWTYALNNLYGRSIPKKFLKPWRLFTGVLILTGLPILAAIDSVLGSGETNESGLRRTLSVGIGAYFWLCSLMTVLFCFVTILRCLRRPPANLLNESTRTIDFWERHKQDLIGDGKWSSIPKLPGNCLFRVDFTQMTLALKELPHAWDGLSILLLSDLHFHGTPSQLYFQQILDEIAQQPTPDLVVLAGDYLDSDTHHSWIATLLGQLKWKEHGIAILGNHDEHHDPERIREELTNLGFRVLSHSTEEVTIRGEPCVLIGNESPWFSPPPSLEKIPKSCFRLCISHSPDQFYWGIANQVDLMLCGHVHGGQIRLPVIGSIFIPSVYSRRFDMGVFAKKDSVLVVSRGVSGKEPLRFQCHPQVIWMTLRSKENHSDSIANSAELSLRTDS